MEIRIEFDAHDEVIVESCPREAGHAFRRITKRQGFSPFLLEVHHPDGTLAWDIEWDDPDLWLDPEDLQYVKEVGADPVLIRLIFINGDTYRRFRNSEHWDTILSDLRNYMPTSSDDNK